MPNTRVIDASLALRLALPGPDQARVQQVMDGWQQSGDILIAPDLWLYEITSALTKAVHFGALSASEGRRLLDLLNRLGVALTAPEAAIAALAYEWTLRLGRAASYDSFYLALAEASGAELWTADHRLAAAVALPWVHAV